MLYTSHDILLAIVALIATNHGLTHQTREIGVFSPTLGDTSPTRIKSHIHHRAIGPVDAKGRRLLGSDAGSLLNSLHVP